MSDFLQEFDEYLDSLTHLPGRLIIAGDFNIHVEDLNDPDTINFNHLISNYGLIQHISISTHIGGGGGGGVSRPSMSACLIESKKDRT